jgi:hypothetical protein
MNVKSGSHEGRAAQHLGHLLRFSPLILRQLAAFSSSSPILLFIQVLFLVDSSDQLCRPRRNLYSSDDWDVFLAFILQPPFLARHQHLCLGRATPHHTFHVEPTRRISCSSRRIPRLDEQTVLDIPPPFQHPYSLPYKLRPTRSLCTGTPASPPMPGGSATGTTESRAGE